MQVRCVDNTLAKDQLTIGKVYEVAHVNEYYDTYVLEGFDGYGFTKRRFEMVDTPEPEITGRFRPKR